jgi:hypothetical protein
LPSTSHDCISSTCRLIAVDGMGDVAVLISCNTIVWASHWCWCRNLTNRS